MKNPSQLPSDVRLKLFLAVQEIFRSTANAAEREAGLDDLREHYARKWPGVDFTDIGLPLTFHALDPGGKWNSEWLAILNRQAHERWEAEAAELLPRWLDAELAVARETMKQGGAVLVRRVAQVGEVDNPERALERLIVGLEAEGWVLDLLTSTWSTKDETFFLPALAPPPSGGTFTSVGPGGRTTGYIVSSPAPSAGVERHTVTSGHILYTAVFRRAK